MDGVPDTRCLLKKGSDMEASVMEDGSYDLSSRPKHKSLREAKIALMGDIGYVQKTGRQQGFTFASDADIIRAVRPKMAYHGLTVRVKDIAWIESVMREKGEHAKSQQYLGVAKFTWVVTHVDSGETEESVSIGEAQDGADKRAGKIQTYARKYFLRDWLLLETGDDPDEIGEGRQELESPVFSDYSAKIDSCKSIEELKAVGTQMNVDRNITRKQKEGLREVFAKKMQQIKKENNA